MTSIMSPIDGAPMRKMNRFGVEIDVCTRTGGVWLDKGELEKIVDLMRSEGGHQQRGREATGDRYDTAEYLYEDEDDPPETGNRRNRRRRSRLLDIFDF